MHEEKQGAQDSDLPRLWASTQGLNTALRELILLGIKIESVAGIVV